MKRLFLFSLFFVCPLALSAQVSTPRVDTLYYDHDWKGVEHKSFADYYRVALYPKDPNAKKLFRDYYIDGTLQGKGEFISIDPNDDSKTIFDGVIEAYYKNGKTQRREVMSKGILNGDFVEYYEDGLIKRKGSFSNGLQTGLYTEFNDDGSYYQMEFIGGKPAHEYFVYCNPDGLMVKLKISDNSVYWESPKISERETVYKDGVNWLVYQKNGITVAETCTTVNDYGKWHKLDIIISNDSLVPIEFDPDNCLVAYSVGSDYAPTDLHVCSSDEYMKKVNRAQTWEAVAVGLSEGLAAANAGYSTSTSTTTSSYAGSASLYGRSSSYGSASAYGSGGYAYGNYSGSSTYSGYGSYSGYGTTTTTTRTYDAAAAYQARVLSQQRMADFSNAQWQERHAKEMGYLKKNTIQPGETISGYINVERKEGEAMFNTINIEDAQYHFVWRFGKDDSFRINEEEDPLVRYANVQINKLEVGREKNFFAKDGYRITYEEALTDYFSWFKNNGITDEKTIKRVIDLENQYINSQFESIDDLIANNKIKKAAGKLKRLREKYAEFPISIKEQEDKVESYASRLNLEEMSQKKPQKQQKKSFDDGLYN